MDKQTLINKLIAVDNNRARSKQTAVGVSSLGDCRRKVWHIVKGDTGNANGTRLPAIMGTAIHAAIEEAFAESGALLEHRVEVDGYPPATIDYYKDGEVVDWKTIKLSGRDFFVNQQKRWQVQTYGYLMALSGYEVHTVTLVGIPRDGNENDIVVYSEPYDPTVAEQAFAWLDDIKSRTEPPSPERDATSWCAKFCQFYGDLCAGIPKDISGSPITDPFAADAAERYMELNERIKQLEVEKDAAKAALEGVVGITMSGVKVSWSEIAGRKTPDTDAIKTLLGDVPMKTGEPSLRLVVK